MRFADERLNKGEPICRWQHIFRKQLISCLDQCPLRQDGLGLSAVLRRAALLRQRLAPEAGVMESF